MLTGEGPERSPLPMQAEEREAGPVVVPGVEDGVRQHSLPCVALCTLTQLLRWA